MTAEGQVRFLVVGQHDRDSQSFEFIHGALVSHIARVQRRGRLEQQYLDFVLSDRPVNYF